MPSTITHGYFALDVYKKINNKKYIDIENLKTFAQGPDILFFYHSLNYKKSKNIRDFGRYMQKNKTQDFFYNLIEYIKNNKLEKNKQVISFLYGFIMHYSLDLEVHPYVFYKTGIYDNKKIETYKYKSLHHDIEKFLDSYIVNKKEGINPKKFKLHKMFFNTKKYDRSLKDTIDYTFEKTYNKHNMSKYYYLSTKIMKLSYYLIRYDPYSIKRYIYKTIYKLMPFLSLNLELLSYAEDYKNKMHYLNLEKKTWNHPCTKEEIYNYSFDELYEIALNKALNLIEETNKMLYENKSIEYTKEIFINLSYTTGKNCTIKSKMQYFEF